MESEASRARRDLEHMLDDENAEPKALPLSLLKDITGGFSADQEIGRGGFAVVYKGIVGSRAVAVKRLIDPLMDETKFHREVECLIQVKHKNAVRFLGYCADRQGNMQRYKGKFVMADVHERLLCFEYISKGSLQKYIADNNREWAKCYKIIKEICEGIQYLHDNHIVHLDLKPDNILLDDNMSPKICDFGLSRCFEANQSREITKNIIGTLGYFAPELFGGGLITRSADLYSLGVVIINILIGKGWYEATEEKILKSWSDRLERSERDRLCKQIQACYEIALECMDNNREKRPDSAQNIIDRLCATESIQEMAALQCVQQKLSDTSKIVHQDRPDRTMRQCAPTDCRMVWKLLDETRSNFEMAKLLCDENWLSIEGYNGGLVFYNMDRVELFKINDVSQITLSDLQNLNYLRSIHFKRCDHMLSAELDDSVVLHSVQNLHIEELNITGDLFSKVLRCFPAVSQLSVTKCHNLELLPMEDGVHSHLRTLQSFKGFNCGKLFSRWIKGEVGGGARAIKPFPTSLRELKISFEPSMKSMGLFSNLTSLTSLRLVFHKGLTMDGFNPLITVNLKKLVVNTMYLSQGGIPIVRDLLSRIASSKLLHADSFQLEKLCVDSISAALTAPICSHLAPTLNTLQFKRDRRAIIFTEEQEHALQLLSSLRHLQFYYCDSLESLPQGLRGLSSLKTLKIIRCEKIGSLLPKEDLPTSLEELQVKLCSPEVTKQAEELYREDPWFSIDV